MTGPIQIEHRFPTYHAVAAQQVADGSGEFVHALHAQALADRLLLALECLKQGQVGKARDLIEDGCNYLSKTNHTR